MGEAGDPGCLCLWPVCVCVCLCVCADGRVWTCLAACLCVHICVHAEVCVCVCLNFKYAFILVCVLLSVEGGEREKGEGPWLCEFSLLNVPTCGAELQLTRLSSSELITGLRDTSYSRKSSHSQSDV